MKTTGEISAIGPDESLGDYVRLLGSRLRGELARATPVQRRRVIATTLFDAAGEIARDADRRVVGSAAFLMPLAQQIDLWFTYLAPEAAIAKATEAAALHVSPMLRDAGRRAASA